MVEAKDSLRNYILVKTLQPPGVAAVARNVAALRELQQGWVDIVGPDELMVVVLNASVNDMRDLEINIIGAEGVDKVERIMYEWRWNKDIV